MAGGGWGWVGAVRHPSWAETERQPAMPTDSKPINQPEPSTSTAVTSNLPVSFLSLSLSTRPRDRTTVLGSTYRVQLVVHPLFFYSPSQIWIYSYATRTANCGVSSSRSGNPCVRRPHPHHQQYGVRSTTPPTAVVHGLFPVFFPPWPLPAATNSPPRAAGKRTHLDLAHLFHGRRRSQQYQYCSSCIVATAIKLPASSQTNTSSAAAHIIFAPLTGSAGMAAVVVTVEPCGHPSGRLNSRLISHVPFCHSGITHVTWGQRIWAESLS